MLLPAGVNPSRAAIDTDRRDARWRQPAEGGKGGGERWSKEEVDRPNKEQQHGRQRGAGSRKGAENEIIKGSNAAGTRSKKS